MGARYTSVDTRDGREQLVPNEDLVTQRVINWSYTSNLMRLDVKFSTTYDRSAQDAGRRRRGRAERGRTC